MNKCVGVIDIQGMTGGSCVNSIENHVGVIPGVLTIKVNLPEKEASVELDTAVVTMEEVLDKINSMGFISSVRKSTEDKAREARLPPDFSKSNESGDQPDLAPIFGGAGPSNLERGDQPSHRKLFAALTGAEGASKNITELVGVLEGIALPGEENPVAPKAAKRRLSTKPACAGSPDLHPVVEKKVTVVVFDVETSGTAKSDEVIQLSATSVRGNFNAYILPVAGISIHASKLHHITEVNGKLYHRNQLVPAKSKEEAWKDFIRFCEGISPVLLVGHNVNFDARFTMNELARVNLTAEFVKFVAGFSDTLPLMRGLFPDLENHKLDSLITEVLGSDYVYDIHNAEADVKVLMEVLTKLNISAEKLMEYSFTVSSFVQHQKNLEEGKNMEVLYSPRRVTRNHLKNLAVAGYTLETLKMMAEKNSQDDFIGTLAAVVPQKQASIIIYETLRELGE